MKDSAAVQAGQGSDWQVHQCPRFRAPPLRFRGRLLDWQQMEVSHVHLFIGIFARKVGGLTVALCRLTQAGTWVEDAFCAEGLSEAVEAVERRCADLVEMPNWLERAAGGDIDILARDVIRYSRIANEVFHFQLLVGQALDRWIRSSIAVEERYARTGA